MAGVTERATRTAETTASVRILAVDDDKTVRSLLAAELAEQGYDVLEAENVAEGVQITAERMPDLAFVDLRLPDGDGLTLLRRLREIDPVLPVILFSGFGTISTAVEAMQLGAVDFLEKPFTVDQLNLAVERALRGRALWRELLELRERVGGGHALVGRSAALKRVLREVRQIAAAPNTTVLVRGESGVGKELVATAIHRASSRASEPFVAVNCAALTETILESELFGYERGAFSGALNRGKAGLFESANRGTLFLDEVGEMGPGLQAKLLRVLQERTFLRVGGVTPIAINIRVIAATNRDLEAAVAAKEFREDLYFRLNVMEIRIPPLRKRAADIPRLARSFLGQFARELGKRVRGFTKSAMEELVAYPWPGNIRELRNTIERAAILSPGPLVKRRHLRLVGSCPAPPDEVVAAKTLAEVERAHITRVLERCRGNKTRAAEELGIHRTTLVKKVDEYGLRSPSSDVANGDSPTRNPSGD